MKIIVTQLIRDRDTEDMVFIEKTREIHREDVACLYKDKYGVYIYLKNGSRVKVKHPLSEIQGLLLL